MERDRLSHVQQNYIRPETLSRANARLVDYQADNSSGPGIGWWGSHQRGMTILPEDMARLSPIGHEHVNAYGKYSFPFAEPIQKGAFHPLRELDEMEPQTEIA